MAHFSLMNVFGKNIAACLAAYGWSKQQLADQCGIDRAVVSKIIGGKRDNITLRTAETIADALQIPLSDLLSVRFRAPEMAA